MVNITAIPAFADNYIWMIQDSGSREVVLVDPGEAEPVLALLAEQDLSLAAILITHHHGDHTGGIRDIIARHPAPVYGPALEAIKQVSHPLREPAEIDLAGGRLHFRVLDVPGHTRGHIAYLGHGGLFCGDTLFTNGCGRLFEGTPEQMYTSLEKIRALDPATLVYCAHEYTMDNIRFAKVVEPHNPFLIERDLDCREKRRQNVPTVPALLALEMQTNPFLRCQEPVVVQAAEGFAGRRLASGAQVFGVVRHWKDTLD